MVGGRRYQDACAAAHALDLIGERWALLVVRELMTGPKRFSDLRAGLPGISANVLTQRLDGLEATGIIQRRVLPPPFGARVYELTPWGYESEPIFRALGRWAVRSPFHDPTMPFSAASLMLSLRTMFAPQRAVDLSGRIGLIADGQSFLADVGHGTLFIRPASIDGADATLAGTAPAIAACLHGGEPIAALEAAGVLSANGDRLLLARFATCFPRPEKAPAPRSLSNRALPSGGGGEE